PELRGLQLRALSGGATLAVPPAWARAYPQSAHLLHEETAAWQKSPWSFAVG
ncbi:MAG: exopolyphosphatase, partial [Comamonadaceae bacterium]